MRPERAVIIAVTILAACGQSDDTGLRLELRNQSAAVGLALAAANAGSIDVIPFDGQEEHLKSEYSSPISTFGRAGRMVLWWAPHDFFDMRGEFVVESMNGERVSRGRPTMSGFSPVGLSEASGRIVFYGTRQTASTLTGLYWASMDFTHVAFIDEATDAPDWSPDGQALVYEKNGQIYVFDVTKNSSRILVSGQSPTWSQNGKWVAFVTPEGRASLVTTEGVPVRWPLSSHQPISPVRWSPDGSYVSFSEALPSRFALLDTAARLVVCRVSDGKEITVRKFSAESVNYATFHWIVNYQKFCGQHKSRETHRNPEIPSRR
jgi:hypothetical protein